ncbi:MAG: outer membrane beta-barrel protein [Pararhodobacter sp.]|nr:outer membrane beta-barrel protein [Pararhodobacter sp.]
MKSFFLSILFAAFGTAALASGPTIYVDPPVVPPPSYSYDWNGGYIGIGLAYTSAESSINLPAVSVPGATGPSLGVLVGYNWQRSNTVMGVEAALNFSNLSGNNTCGLGAPFGCTMQVNNFAALRARLGYAMDRTLLFVTAGYATDLRNYSVTNGIVTASTNIRFNGPVVGVGIEHALSNSWTVRGDLEHYFLGSQPMGGATVSASTSLVRFSIVRRF